MKKVKINLEDYQIKITLVGDQELLDQITKESKTIKFYSNGAEFKLIDMFLFEKFEKCLIQQEFWVQNKIFASDLGNTYLILIGREQYLILNNNEVRIPMFICNRNHRQWNEMVKNCNTLQYTPEKKEKFELISNKLEL